MVLKKYLFGLLLIDLSNLHDFCVLDERRHVTEQVLSRLFRITEKEVFKVDVHVNPVSLANLLD